MSPNKYFLLIICKNYDWVLIAKRRIETPTTAPPPLQLPTQVRLQTLPQTEQKWPASSSESENNSYNADGAVYVKRESESGQLMNTSQAPVEEVDQDAGYEDSSQEGGEGFDLNNYTEKISEGVNIGKFKCNICGHVSSRKQGAQKHVESKHFPGLFEYTCALCAKKFNTYNKYNQHRSRHHFNKK